MKLICPFEGSKAPDLEIEPMMGWFIFKQGDVEIKLSNRQALAFADYLENLEVEAQRLVNEETDNLGSRITTALKADGETGDRSIEVLYATGRLAFAIHIRGENGSVAMDLDAIWAARVFMREAVRQEEEGLYRGWI